MRSLFSTLSLIFILLGTSNIISLANKGIIIEKFTFGTTGAAFILLINLYGILAFISALFGKKNSYRILLIAGSVILIAVNLTLTFVAVYGFQEP